MQPVCGFVVDLIGLRLGFALFAMLWSIVGVAHGFASGWLSLGILRGFLGLFEAAAIPSGMKAVAEWFPDREKSVAVGYFNAGTSLGAAIAPPLVVFLSMRFGWQAAFMATGALGFVWAALWYAQYRSPADHPRITPQERALIRDGRRRCRPCRSAAFATSSPRGASGHRAAALLRRPRVADLQLLDSALSRDRAPHGTQADRDLRVDAVSRGRPRRHRGRLPVAVSRETVRCRSCGRALPASRSARC